jgi:hypothetical protein
MRSFSRAICARHSRSRAFGSRLATISGCAARFRQSRCAWTWKCAFVPVGIANEDAGQLRVWIDDVRAKNAAMAKGKNRAVPRDHMPMIAQRRTYGYPSFGDQLGGHSRTVSVRVVPSGAVVRVAPVLFVRDSICE